MCYDTVGDGMCFRTNYIVLDVFHMSFTQTLKELLTELLHQCFFLISLMVSCSHACCGGVGLFIAHVLVVLHV